MERKPNGANGISKSRTIPHQITKKLERSHEVNRKSNLTKRDEIYKD